MHLGYTFTCPLVFFKTSLMLTWLIHTWIKHTHIIWFFLPWERICHFKLCEQPKKIVFWVHQSKKVRPDFEKVTMKFWIPSSTWLPSTPNRTWLLSIHTEKTRCIVFYTRQRVHAYHTHRGDEATHAKCWPYGRYQPRHHFRESEFFVLQWTL